MSHMSSKVIELSPKRRALAALRHLTGTRSVPEHIILFYNRGAEVGAEADKMFWVECPAGDVAAAKQYSARLKMALDELFAGMINDGASEPALAAWFGGLQDKLCPALRAHVDAWRLNT